jgi:hypothetical protein
VPNMERQKSVSTQRRASWVHVARGSEAADKESTKPKRGCATHTRFLRVHLPSQLRIPPKGDCVSNKGPRYDIKDGLRLEAPGIHCSVAQGLFNTGRQGKHVSFPDKCCGFHGSWLRNDTGCMPYNADQRAEHVRPLRGEDEPEQPVLSTREEPQSILLGPREYVSQVVRMRRISCVCDLRLDLRGAIFAYLRIRLFQFPLSVIRAVQEQLVLGVLRFRYVFGECFPYNQLVSQAFVAERLGRSGHDRRGIRALSVSHVWSFCRNLGNIW